MAKTPSLKQMLLAWADYENFVPKKHSLLTDIVRDQAQTTSRLMQQFGNGASVQGFAAVGAVALLVWNWQLLIAICMGVGTTVLAYRSPHGSLKLMGMKLVQSLFDSPLLLAFITGLLSLVISYSTLLIWQNTGQVGIALAVVVQGFCLLSALGLLMGQVLEPSKVSAEDSYEQWVTQLLSTEPLQRLVAVRRLSQIELLTMERRQELSDYFQLLLAQETQPQIREAVLLGLRCLDAQTESKRKLPRSLQSNTSPRQALQLKRRIKVRKERVYAELEAQPEESWVQ